MELEAMVASLDAYLDPDTMDDYGPNGLQVEGRGEVGKIVTGVTASRNLIEAAIAEKADAVLVHHGLFWKGAWPHRLTGWMGARVRLLVKNDISLIGYHLPLDVHPELGNNVSLLESLGLFPKGRFGDGDIGMWAEFDEPLDAPALSERLEDILGGADANAGRALHHIAGGGPVRRIGVVSGAGQRYLEAAVAAGCDAYLTGEASEMVTHVARETGTHYYWAGHHATERMGIQRLGEWIAKKHGLDVEYVDDPNPV
ncbi:MAG: Nif3-like dinuclear metal center hexameric protein [Euryarchaeota archaeon]|nr:Nif3-like dinuclear metal center hexameric protein [Euryarchaeota archaeon]